MEALQRLFKELSKNKREGFFEILGDKKRPKKSAFEFFGRDVNGRFTLLPENFTHSFDVESEVGAQTNAKQFFPAIVLKIAEGVANIYFGLGE